MPTMSKARTAVFIITIVFYLGSSGCMTNETHHEPFNQVVILIDASGSYRSRQAEAIASATKRLQELAELELKRWEEDKDEISVISLDAVPEVIWKGHLKDLKELVDPDNAVGKDPQATWATRFKARTDYASCTDVGAAFRLATTLLNGDSRYVDKYLIGFTDVIDEPPTASIKSCKSAKHPSLPPEDFPWEALRNVSVSIFWVPPEQKLAWQRVVTSHNLSNNFALYTSSESSQVKLEPIKRADREPDAAETAANREKIFGAAKAIGVIVAILAVALLGLLLWGRRRRAAKPAATRSRPASARRGGEPAVGEPRPVVSRSIPQRNRQQ